MPSTTMLLASSSSDAAAAGTAGRPQRNNTVDDLTATAAAALHQTQHRTSTDAVAERTADSGGRHDTKPLEYLTGADVDPSPVIVGDLSCLKDTFRPAPTVPNADIKYLR